MRKARETRDATLGTRATLWRQYLDDAPMVAVGETARTPRMTYDCAMDRQRGGGRGTNAPSPIPGHGGRVLSICSDYFQGKRDRGVSRDSKKKGRGQRGQHGRQAG